MASLGGVSAAEVVGRLPSLFSSSSPSLIVASLVALFFSLFVLQLLYNLLLHFIGAPSMANSYEKEKMKMQADFKSHVKVDDRAPAKDTLEKVADFPLLDVDRKKHCFGSLWKDDEEGARRVLVVFIRHFFCGNCQEYLRTLSLSLPPSLLSTLFPRTQIVVIGCGAPDLIPMYIQTTQCPYPIYADPTRRLYDALAMTKTLALGSNSPEYMQKSMAYMAVRSMIQELRSGRFMLRGGDFRQVGGEFLFENGKVTWCHRMRNTRDHAEIPDLRKHLGLDGEEKPVKKRWSTAALGKGLGRRLSSRRQSWAAGWRSSRVVEKKEGMVVNGMEGVKEEEGQESGTAEDALAKLEGKGPNATQHSTNTATTGIINDHAIEPSKEAHREAVVVDGATNGIMNGYAIEPSKEELKDHTSTSDTPTLADDHPTEPRKEEHREAIIMEGADDGAMNGHAIEPSKHTDSHTTTDTAMNGHAIEPSKPEERETNNTNGIVTGPPNGTPYATPRTSISGIIADEKPLNGTAMNETANGHINA